MEQESGGGLDRVRWIVILIYTSCLVLFPLVGRLIPVQPIIPPEVGRLLPRVLLLLAISEYGISLFLERLGLTQAARARGGLGAATAAIVAAAFGASFAVYGLVLTLLGQAAWSALFYLLCLIHGLHLAMRWARYEQAAAGELEIETK